MESTESITEICILSDESFLDLSVFYLIKSLITCAEVKTITDNLLEGCPIWFGKKVKSAARTKYMELQQLPGKIG
ncbi:MAG: hypothetical protein IPO45_17165 [Saprospiraceae bacterium]|nr:hypothetical protein [Candidatus Brachybacter algidus]